MSTSHLGWSGRMAAYFQSSQLTPLLALAALLLGVFALIVTPREEEPQIDVTMANVWIPFPGASVADVEALVATPAEQVLARMVGVAHVYSVSRPGMALLTVQFEVGVPRTEALVRLYDTVQAHRDWAGPQAGVLEPVVEAKGVDDVPILALTLWRADATQGAQALERVAHALEVELKRVAGTRDVRTLGGPGHVVHVALDADRLAAFNVTALDVQTALQSANAVMPVGTLVHDNATALVETGHVLRSVEDVRQVVVRSTQARPVYLSDVARVTEGPALPQQYVWMGLGAAAQGAALPGHAGSEFPAVTIQITKKAGENAVAVAERVLAQVDTLRNTLIPTDVEVTVTRNYGATASDKAVQLIKKLLFATLSVVVLVLLALGWREAAIVGVAVILTLAATLFASWAWGFTLNRVSLFALIFSIGILVDDAIVVVENIHRHRALEGGSLLSIIPKAVNEVGGPTLLATFTVIAALLPMAFVTGLMGPYMSPIPINASMGMLISLIIALTLTPWLARRWLAHGEAAHGADAMQRWLDGMAERMLAPFVRARGAVRNRAWLGIAVLGAIAVSVSLVVFKQVVLKMLPFDNKSEFQVVVDLPTGTPLEITAATLHDLGAYLATVPEVMHYQAYAGTAAPINFNGLVRQYDLRADAALGDLQVNLVDKSERHRKSHEIAQAVRAPLEMIAAQWNARIQVVEVPPGPPVRAPIVAEVYGPDEAARVQTALRVRAALEATKDVVGVDDSIEEPSSRWLLQVDQRKAAAYGVSASDIVHTLRMGLVDADGGMGVSTLFDRQSKYTVPIRVSLPAQEAGSLAALLKLAVRTPSGVPLRLSELVRPVAQSRDAARFHKDLLPVVYVVADQAGTLDSPLYGMFAAREHLTQARAQTQSIDEYFIRPPQDPYRAVAIKWDGEWQITYETFRDMGIAYAVGLVFIYLLVVAQFGSYGVPLVIMVPIPLTLIGVMPGHALMGAQFTATSMIGMIALAGIIVRNSILLVDFIKLKQAHGVALADAVIQSAAARAKPIGLTALAAMLGAFFILDDPIFNGLAISLIFGIAVSTVLTLVIIPVLYDAAYRNGSSQT